MNHLIGAVLRNASHGLSLDTVGSRLARFAKWTIRTSPTTCEKDLKLFGVPSSYLISLAGCLFFWGGLARRIQEARGATGKETRKAARQKQK